jgi:nucleoside-diphosphate-sugar epimerase
MKTALIIGVTGNFGSEMGLALKSQNWNVKALMRDASKAPEWLNPRNVVQGSARDEKAVNKACEGVDLIVYAANPKYHRWHQEALQMLEPVVRAAEVNKLSLLFPGNVYNFAPSNRLINEASAMAPPSDKGEVRIAMEQRLKKASKQGAKVTIVRAGDFLGPRTHMSWVDFMAKKKGDQMTFSVMHSTDHTHYWTYLPDLCANAALLVEEEGTEFEVFHDPGLALKTADWQQAFKDNGQLLKIKDFPWWFFKALSLFSPILREVMKMRYLWRDSVVMDGSKMTEVLGARIQQTPLADVVDQLFLTQKETKVQMA